MSWSRVSFASWSTISLPSMPQWLGTQQKQTWVPLSLSAQRRFMILQMRGFSVSSLSIACKQDNQSILTRYIIHTFLKQFLCSGVWIKRARKELVIYGYSIADRLAFTDGSKMNERMGAAAVINRHFQNGETTCRHLTKSLPDNTIFAAEATAITLALNYYQHIGPVHHDVIVYSDSMSCLQVIRLKILRTILFAYIQKKEYQLVVSWLLYVLE